MARLSAFLPRIPGKSPAEGDTVVLEKGESHHLVRVLRAKAASRVRLLDGVGRHFHAELTQPDAKAAKLKVVDVEVFERLTPAVTLFQGYPKGKTIESILKVGIELGLTRLIPMLTQHVEGKPAGNLDKWTQIAREAAKQSGAPWLPEVSVPVSLTSALAQLSQDPDPLLIVGSLEGNPPNLFTAFEGLERRDYQSIAIFVGPEGDFTPDEYAVIRDAGAVPVSMGNQILRSETAAHVFTAMVTNWFRR